MKPTSLLVLDTNSKAHQIFDLLDVKAETKKEYKYRIGLFLQFIKNTELNRNSFREYKHYLEQRSDYTVSTKNKYLATARIFCKELNFQGLLPLDITLNTKGFQQSKLHKLEGLNQEEIARVVSHIKSLPKTPVNARIKAITTLLVLQGLRQIEVRRLNYEDLDLANSRAFVRGKGRDDTEPVDLNPETIESIREHIKINKVSSGMLFTCFSNRDNGKRLSTRTIQKETQTIFKILGIDKKTHGYRHYFTTKLIDTYKGDLLEVARYTRHRSLETLQIYNDNIKRKKDLPRFFGTFDELVFTEK